MKEILKHIRVIFTCRKGLYEYQRALLERLESPKREIYDKHKVKYNDADNT